MGPNLTLWSRTCILLPLRSADYLLFCRPTVAIMQWRNEINSHTTGLKVLVWHGASRESDAKELKKFDVVGAVGLLFEIHRSLTENTGSDYVCRPRELFSQAAAWFYPEGSDHQGEVPCSHRRVEPCYRTSVQFKLGVFNRPMLFDSWTKLTTSKNDQPILRKLLLSSRASIGGVSREHRYRIVLVSYTV